ncbi:hypothetical protein scyTo_0018085, partial [Scyliorhinus torazame]|nr:hypothetical protein [Scyliorhinus torazame]
FLASSCPARVRTADLEICLLLVTEFGNQFFNPASPARDELFLSGSLIATTRISCSTVNLAMEKSIVGDCVPTTDSKDFDVFSAMDWKDGIATLPGSNLKFRVNEFDALEIITDETEVERIRKATATTTWSVPTAQEALSRSSILSNTEEPPSMEGILCCENCGHYGTAEEFSHGTKFCSERCMVQTKEKISILRKEPSTCNNEEVTRGNRKKRQKPASTAKGDIKENGEMLKDEEEDIEEKPGELKVLKVTQNNHVRARRKRKGDSGLLKQTLTFGGKRKAWSWASYLEEEKAVVAPTKLFREVSLERYDC